MWAFEKVCCNVATRYALTTPTPVLYMESLADTAKGKVKAAGREAEKKQKKEKEDTPTKLTKETKSSSSDSNNEPASPAP